MIMIHLRKSLSMVLCCALLLFTPHVDAAAQQAGQPSSPSYQGQGAPLSASELQGLVAPIALYPDALVAQILSAATYPDQVAIADYWLQQNKNLTGSALLQAVNTQSWDASVKALTEFPSVLDNMAKNLTWTSSLGEAYHNQQQDVMSAIQTLRSQAKAAGNLKSSSQITVVQQSPQTIVIEPANPQIVYVPQYNPTVVYGTPVQTPGYSTADLVATGLLSFGAGVAVGALMSGGGGCCAWGYSAWHCSWYGYGGAVAYHGAAYYGNAAWHGGYYGDSYYHNGYYGNSYNNYYHNGNYNNAYNNAYHNNSYNNSGYNRTGNNNYSRNTNVSGNTVNVNPSRSTGSSSSGQGDKWGGWGDSSSSRGWGQSGGGGGSSAFSGWGSHSGDDGGGWGSRSASSRGWGSGGGGGWGGRGGGGFGGRR